MKSVMIAAIRVYQKYVSPALPGSCRFLPTCSGYAVEALEHHGAVKGSLLAAVRLLKCHPFHPGGYDPVPDCRNNSRFQISNFINSEEKP